MSVMSRLGRRATDEEGGALIAVIGMMVVAGVVAASVATSTVVAVGRTSTTRAAVQSEAAAETGVNVAELGLRTTGDCLLHGGVYSSSSNPVFTAQVSFYNGSAWVTGCPVPSLATSVKIVSTGTAASLGTSNQSSANTAKIEATYAYTTATGGITATGGAVFGGGTNGLNNLTVTQTTTVTPGGTGPDVVIKNGNYTCQSGTTIKGNLIVQNGSVELNGCIVLGGISASGAVSVNSGTNSVGGNVIAAGIGVAANVNAALVGPNSTVAGYVLAKGTVRIDGKVLGSVTATGTGTSTISPSTKISGALAIGGTLDYGGLYGTLWGLTSCLVNVLQLNLSCALNAAGVVLGTVATNVTSLVAPAAPTTSTWAAYSYSAAPWVAAGYTELTWTGSCTIDNNTANQVFIRQVMASTTPVVVNALGCAKLLFSNSAALQLKLNANVAFVSKSFGIENVTLDSAVGAGLKAWFIVPGPTELAQAQAKLCLDIDGHVNINSGVKVTANVSALIYTPGCIDNSATTWKGQEYAGTVNFGQNVTLDYVPVGLPGTSLDGTVAVAATPGALGARTLLRDVQR